MSTYPPGVLSFLYNVINDTEINQKFSEDQYEVMSFFMLDDRFRDIISQASYRFNEFAARKKEETGYPHLSNADVTAYAKSEVAEHKDEVDYVLKKVKEELTTCYGRFW